MPKVRQRNAEGSTSSRRAFGQLVEYKGTVQYIPKCASDNPHMRFSQSPKAFLQFPSFTSFSTIALPAQHLAILNHCATTFTPRSDVVSFHEFEVELLTAMRANVILLFPYSQFDVFWKGSKVKIMLVSCQHVWDDSRLLLDFAVTHQS